MKLSMLIAVMAVAMSAVAQEQVATTPAPKAPEAKMGRAPMMNRMMNPGTDPVLMFATSPRGSKAIGLTDEQQAKIKELNKSMREKMKALRDQHTADLRAVLTPEQLAKATEEFKNMRARGPKPKAAKPEAKPAEVKPDEAKPAEAKPAEAK